MLSYQTHAQHISLIMFFSNIYVLKCSREITHSKYEDFASVLTILFSKR